MKAATPHVSNASSSSNHSAGPYFSRFTDISGNSMASTATVLPSRSCGRKRRNRRSSESKCGSGGLPCCRIASGNSAIKIFHYDQRKLRESFHCRIDLACLQLLRPDVGKQQDDLAIVVTLKVCLSRSATKCNAHAADCGRSDSLRR